MNFQLGAATTRTAARWCTLTSIPTYRKLDAPLAIRRLTTPTARPDPPTGGPADDYRSLFRRFR